MQWLAEICVKRPVFAVMLILALVVAGVASYLQLGVDRFPKMDMPTVYVRTVYRGAAPEEMESEITQILEDAVATVEGIDELRSISSEGASVVILTFNIDRDIDAATQDVRDAVNGVLNRLPPDVDPPVIRKQDVDSSPILSIAVSGQRDGRELYVLADRNVKNVIESAAGVGQVVIAGATDRAVKINIAADRLAAYGLSIVEIREALTRQNVEIPGGRVDAGAKELSLRTLGRFTSARKFADLVVATVHGTPVRLRDLGEIVDGTKEVRSLARVNGESAVVLQVQRQSGANTVEVIEAVKGRLERARQLLPPDLSVDIIQDQSRYINAAIHEVQKHLISGSILASVVVLLFMRSWRSTLIAAVAIPASIIASFGMMRAMDFTLNNVTMLALVLMVGVVIDDAIVVLENVFHWIEEKDVPPMQAAVGATKEIGLAVLATTLSLVIVFLPVSFLSSVTGRMLFQFGLTATVAILVSLLVSFSLTPMMCSRLLRPITHGGKVAASRRGFYHWIDLGYLACLRVAMRHRWIVLAVSIAVVAANYPLYYFVQKDYIPTNVDEGEFEVRITAPEGATLRTMDATLRQVEADILGVAGVRKVLTTIGSTGLAWVNFAYLFVRLDDTENRTFSLGRLWEETLAGRPKAAFAGNYSQSEKMQEIRKRLSKYTDLRVAIRNQTSLRQGSPVDIDFAISGPDLYQLAGFAGKLRDKVSALPGIVDADVTLRLDKPELLAGIDRERAAMLGVEIQEIADTLRIAVGGDDRVSRYLDPLLDDVYDVELRLVGIDRGSPEAISQLYVRANPSSHDPRNSAAGAAAENGNGRAFTRLDNVVSFRRAPSAARIDRLDRQRMVAVRMNVAPGFALSDRLEAVHAAAEELGMPATFSTRVMGQGRELERTFRDFRWTFILSFIFMYIVLAAQFEHLLHPLTILISLPLAVPFGLVSLWLGGETLNLYSALGILVLFGVVKKAAILQVDHTNQLRAAGMDRMSAILQANRDRLRPILMTTFSFVAGMLPLLIGVGPGSEERRSIAVLTVGGQTLSLLLTLLAVPVVYSFLDDLAGLFVRYRTAVSFRPVERPAPDLETEIPLEESADAIAHGHARHP
ncbi:MAG: efflux RND transporter permease subunit [Rhodopirellula sp.]|nr:efflux RND transporter permease subunit [Rhodopirellula sp.]